MTKATLKDFIKDGPSAMKNGYCPSFISVGVKLIFSVMGIKKTVKLVFSPIWDTYYDGYISQVLREWVGNLIKTTIYLLILISMYLLFPAWWVISYFLFKNEYKRIQTLQRGN